MVGDRAHFFKYRMTATGPKDKNAIIDNKALFVALKGLSDNLSFTQKEMVAGLMKLKEVKSFASLKSEHEKEWADVMAVKVRTACRDLSQAIAKNAKWTKEVFSQRKRPAAAMSGAAAARADTSDGEEIIGEDADGHADDGDGDMDIDEGIGDGDGGDGSDVEAEGGEEELPAEKSEAEEPCPAQPTDIGYICGFDKETNRAYRIPKAQLKHGRKIKKEFTDNLPWVPSGAKPLDACWITFDDGWKGPIPQLFVRDIEAVGIGDKEGSIGFHVKSGREICIRRLKDRDPIFIIAEVGDGAAISQKCSVMIKLFDTEDKAKGFLATLARDYKHNIVKEDALYVERDKRLTTMGLAFKSAKKKPAAARVAKKPLAVPTRPRRFVGEGKDKGDKAKEKGDEATDKGDKAKGVVDEESVEGDVGEDGDKSAGDADSDSIGSGPDGGTVWDVAKVMAP